MSTQVQQAKSSENLRADIRRVLHVLRPVGRRFAAAPPGLPASLTVTMPRRGSATIRIAEGDTPVLLLHGWAITADVNFCHLMKPLAVRHGIVAMDYRGHGRGLPLAPAPARQLQRFSIQDCAEDVAALLDVLGIDKVIVCGYSLGGPIGLEFARRHPDRVGGLVLQATALRFDSPTDQLLHPLFRAIRPLAVFGVGRTAPLRYFNATRARSPQTAALWPWLRNELVQCDPRVIIDAILAEYAFDFRPHVAAVAEIPIAVVVTTRDRAVPPKDQRDTATRLHAEVIEINDDHDVFLDDPEAYVAATLDAVERVSSGRDSLE
ncbi:alpha/beta fold hydrolase [Mycobacterium sp.]|uniref:alpha/beta fold hydrolase n=1 Tax=Mycobacterium sp. TaxID=1785 RepID=UPI003D0A6C3A